ncbi:UDP-glucosyltransferase 2-like [Ischnura elegans]|uniref:UDP-glucosyltransferase 2-like n=1 Tax=Ischnura elegans TaxID=197161 RepID=UPI001ED8A3FA|nr:UDP-glucosyltransferase 2-like [Ischnura elegans]
MISREVVIGVHYLFISSLNAENLFQDESRSVGNLSLDIGNVIWMILTVFQFHILHCARMERKMVTGTWAVIAMCIFLQAGNVSPANILAPFAVASRSHTNIFSTITSELARKGHSFTVITSHPTEPPTDNFRQIDTYPVVGHRMDKFNVNTKLGFQDLLQLVKELTSGVCKDVMQMDEVKSLVKPDAGTKFDLVLVTNFFAECFYGFAHIYNAPIVVLSPAGPMSSTYSAVGNVVLPSFYTEPGLGYSDRMTLAQRILNRLTQVPYALYYKYKIQADVEKEMRVAFGEDIPTISQLEEHVSLVVLNNHFSLNEPRQTVPCLIEAGGLHIKLPKELPKDLKDFLDDAGENGVIYFSLGSILKSTAFPNETRDELMTAFSKIKQRVLWKWGENSPFQDNRETYGLRNGYLSKTSWVIILTLPHDNHSSTLTFRQSHPNVRLFITHGGLLSFQEAAHRGVPLIGITYFGDQDMNMNRVVQLQVGVKVDSQNITATNVLNAINEVLGNPGYSQNMKKLSSIVKDQKDDPLERAIYWIEYVLRHDGAKHLKPAAFYLRWYQIYMLDVIFLIIVLPSLILTSTGLLALKIFRRRCKNREKDVTSTKKTE